ncbi:MAG: sensor histidine kinase [Thermoflexales bacterium]|nr:sensor histidine kinase [Thermoflexales bacterium]MDW8350491.1 sensor histidine kinase [Anaerolineae bacterium]
MIDQLKVFFTINDSIVQFVHGQVFFLLAVMMGVQWFMQRSRLELARALPWLAAFGALEAVAVWGNAFIPLQERLLAPDTIQNLRFLQLLVHLLTFATLLGFGLRLSEPAMPTWAAVYVPLVVVLVATAVLATNRALTSGVDVVNNATVEALLRYGLCLPSALLVAYGLRLQAGRLVGPLKSERLINVLRVAGFGFIFYALVEGVIVPEAPLFPARSINAELLFETTGVPVGIYRSIVGAVIALFLFLSLDAFRIETDRLNEALQRQQSLMAERERISRDLHDGTIQSIYAAGLMVDDARHMVQQLAAQSHNGAAPLAERVHEQLSAVLSVLNKTNEEIRSYIYDLRRSVAGDEDLARGLLDIVTEFRIRTAIPTDWNVGGCGKATFSPEQRQHIYQIVREALSNIARHASATRAQVELHYDECDDRIGARVVRVQIRDNGKGVIQPAMRTGRGLLNMRERAALLNADFSLESEPGRGTIVTLTMKKLDGK